MFPRLVVEVICKCSAHVTVRTKQPEMVVNCWKCTRPIRVKLSRGGGYSIYIRDTFYQHWDEHEHRLPPERYHQISLER